ncbi:MAG TPA: alginate lyase family protein [Roseiflexaceae bacterium]|nr:alginate lyase family protein [Roseiflexaceae bacterium]
MACLRRESYLALNWDRTGRTITLLNQRPFPFDPPVDWQAQPVPDPLWSFKLHSWEWAWPALASMDSRKPVLALWRDWLAQVPLGHGLAWEPHPTSQRLIVWSAAWHLLGGDIQLAAGIAQQAAYLIDHLERDLDNNHLIANTKALAYVGLLFPNLPAAPRWRRIGLKLFWEALKNQVQPDGGHIERSAGYHLSVWLDGLEVALLCRACDEHVPPSAWETLRSMNTFAHMLRRPDGRLPLLNDSVEDEPLALRAVFDLATAVCQHIGDSSIAEPGPRPQPVPSSATATMSHALLDSGYVVLRAGQGHADVYVLFDAGDLGPPHCPGHGHADTLSIEVWGRGEALVVDPGTYQYVAGPWRDYFRGTAAHSTATIDGLDQSVFVGPFRVADLARARLVSLVSDRGSNIEVVGEHDGYTRLRDPVLHRRRIRLECSGTITIEDSFVGCAVHQIALRFHLAPCRVTIPTASLAHATYPGGTQVTFRVCDDGCGSWCAENGWISRFWYQKDASPVLAYLVEAKLPVMITTEMRIT